VSMAFAWALFAGAILLGGLLTCRNLLRGAISPMPSD
jgi:hypothetical protein